MKAIFFIFFIFIYSFQARADEPNAWAGVGFESWIGKLPTQIVDGKALKLIETDGVKKITQKIVPAYEMDAINKYYVESLVSKIDNFIIINKCMPHNCPSELAMIVIDMNSPRIWVGLFLRDDTHSSTRWYSNGDDYSVLPNTIKQSFLERHGD
ncbi:hypothetical protein QZJ86_07285 [Methylomonas montana]|uniref:hypothetical protein n=1 Tax=Methylomonas montana TaxID=3058963 RepID=UPI00265B6589|nr:hypothetical protein [Methylomonas montana]WKJ91935.1 hypothetical protein QZJ86_07285 [Methylomonas montana]